MQNSQKFVHSYIFTHKIYVITPRDHMSHDLSYFSGPRTSGAGKKVRFLDAVNNMKLKSTENKV